MQADTGLSGLSGEIGAITTLILDTFSSGGLQNLSAHTPDVNKPGHPWVAQSGVMSSSGSGQCTWGSNSGVPADATYTIDCGNANVTITFSGFVPQAISDDAGIVGRFTDKSNYWLCEVNSGSNTSSGIWERKTAVWTQQAAINPNLTAGTAYTVVMILSGNNIQVSINGTQTSFSSSDFASNTLHGITMQTTGEQLTQFKVTTP